MKHVKTENLSFEDFGSILVKNIFNEESKSDISIAEIKLQGDQKYGFDKKSDIFYYILDGEGKFFTEDEIINVTIGDLIYIPKNTKYKDEGNLRLLAISCPKFNSSNHVYLD